MRRIVIYAFLIMALFHFSEGKPCPEQTKAHRTRCDAYYKCTELPTKVHVWLPVKCEQGLVYEHNVRTCVLPGDDWDCIPDEQQEKNAATMVTTMTQNSKEADIDIIGDMAPDEERKRIDDDTVEIVLESDLSSEEDDDEVDDAVSHNNDDSHYESSGDGKLNDLDGFMKVQNRESIKDVHEKQQEVQANMEKLAAAMEKPQLQELKAELKQMSIATTPSSTKAIDPNLKAHLQRLSQLIDGLKQTYQTIDTPQEELRPDQLNAFLAHFNIKNRFDTLRPTTAGIDYKAPPISSTTEPPIVIKTTIATRTPVKPLRTTTMTQRQPHLPVATRNKTLLQEHLNNHKLHAETKVVLSSALPKYYGDGQQHDLSSGGVGGGGGYSNSQIVVNRPEGSVLFTLPNYGGSAGGGGGGGGGGEHSFNEKHYYALPHDYNEPKISEETLKTVLELSKQMIAAQNVPKVIPNPAYYAQQILQPVIITPSTHAVGSFANFYAQNGGQYTQYAQSNGYQAKPYAQQYGNGHKQTHDYRKPSTTIIHNNVIPVHIATSNSGEREVVDSYGNSLGLYPPLHAAGDKDNNNAYDQRHTHFDSNNNNNYLATVTTVRPTISFTTTATHYAGQYPPPYASSITLTTPRPFDRQPTPETIATYYTPSPHLNEHNVNRVFQTESYATSNTGSIPRPFDLQHRPSSNGYNLFPTQIDVHKVKIRPNSQKIESMEDDNSNDEATNNNDNYNQHNAQALTYSSSNSGDMDSNGNNNNNDDDAEDIAMSAQLAHSTYLDQTLSIDSGGGGGGIRKHSYLPRPSTATHQLHSYNNNNNNNNNGNSELSSGYGGSSSSSAFSKFSQANKPAKYPSFGHSNSGISDTTQLVNFGGHFISLDVFQNSILPMVGQSNALPDLNNVEVITCQTGVRQPNITDCTRYFVCSKKDGKVLSYSCPPYTGFNQQTRICDAHTYAQCSPSAIVNSYTVSENKRIQMEAYKAIQEAKKRQEAAMKAQSIANLLQQYNSGTLTSQSDEQTAEKDMLSPYMQQAAAMTGQATTQRSPTGSGVAVKKRKYYCKEGDKIPDQTSISNYFVCYKNEQGQMKGHKMTCSKGLLFCPKTRMCTLPEKCT